MKIITKIQNYIMPNQSYENYWSLTNAFIDYSIDSLFFKTLKICIEYIDKYKEEVYSEEKYKRLQDAINSDLPKHEASIRKSINQLVKMGFIQTHLVDYHSLAKEYLNSRTEKKAKVLLSKIVYSNASLNRSATKESSRKELNFLIRSLEEHGKLSKEEIIGLMIVDLNKYRGEFITKEDLSEYKEMQLI